MLDLGYEERASLWLTGDGQVDWHQASSDPVVLDPTALESAACECYAKIRAEFDRPLAPH